MLPATPRVAACSTCGDSRGGITCSTCQQLAAHVHVVEAVTASTVIYSYSLYYMAIGARCYRLDVAVAIYLLLTTYQ